MCRSTPPSGCAGRYWQEFGGESDLLFFSHVELLFLFKHLNSTFPPLSGGVIKRHCYYLISRDTALKSSSNSKLHDRNVLVTVVKSATLKAVYQHKGLGTKFLSYVFCPILIGV